MSAGREAYQAALQTWLWERNEASLSVAYEVGRNALNEGVGILELLELHKSCLEQLDQGSPSLNSALGELLFELISPFEMTLNGYQQANSELRRLNDTLARQNQQLELSNQDLEAFSYSISHDLRAPVRQLVSYSRLLSHKKALGEDSPDMRKYLEAIVRCGSQMEEMIEALLNLSRLSREGLSLSPVNLSQLVQEVYQEMADAYPQSRLQVQPDLEQVLDRTLFRMVLQNLLGNALKFSSKTDQPLVRFGKVGQNFFVSDNGVGFNEAYKERLFKPFQRLHPASEFEGTGVGLATVQRIIERHGGKIWAESQQNVQTTFFFRLGEES